MSRRVLIPALLVGLLVAAGKQVTATVSVDVSNNGSGSRNSVNINSNTQNSDSTTDVKVETNGEVKTFHAEGSDDVNYQSDDGSVRVNVNNNGADQNNDEDDEDDLTDDNEATASPTLAPTPDQEEIEADREEAKNILEALLHRWEEWNEAFREQLKRLFG